MADTLYPFTKIIGVEKPIYLQKYPTWGTFVTQCQYDGLSTPYLGFFDEDNNVIYELLGTSMGSNLYKWSFDLSIYTNLYDKCLHTYIYTNQQNVVDNLPIDAIAESELLQVSSKYNDLVLQFQYTNNEVFDTVSYSGYTGYAYIASQLGQDYQFEESTTVYEQSNGVIQKLSARLKDKRKLLTDYMPKFEHEKLSLILMQDNISINGESFVKNNEYTVSPINRYALSQGSTLLNNSIYNFVNSNCL
jgi:hypothetical protein